MIRTLPGLALALTLLASGHAAAEIQFRAAGLAPTQVVTLEPLEEKTPAPVVDGLGRLRVGIVRELEASSPLDAWTPRDGGFVTRLRTTSQGAAGLRVKLALGTVPGTMEVRAQGTDGRVEMMAIDPAQGSEAWTPWTEGETQVVEIFSRVAPSQDAVSVSSLLHFATSPFANAAASCTLSTACSSADATLDAAIAERKKSVVKIQFVDNGLGYVCTATLIDTPRRPAAYVLTANHCIDSTASASSITGFWFYEASACASASASLSTVQTAGGAQLVFTNFNVDSTLLLMNQAPPTGALYSPLNAALVTPGQSIVSISHPHGDTARWAIGSAGIQVRDDQRPYSMYGVTFTRGIIEPGSSGSGLFTMVGGHLELRGVLSQADTELSCTSPGLMTVYARLEALYPEIAQYIGAATVAADDAPNRPQDLTPADFSPSPAVALNAFAGVALDNRRIDYAGDVDVYRFFLTTPAYVSTWTEGALDTVGTILDGNGSALEANDDADWLATANNNFGITRMLQAGTYYVHVANWSPAGTGAYNLRLRADAVDANYTDLWSNPAESGWGLNINHQGNTLFATLYTYDADGTPLWLVMSNGDKQADGSYAGQIYRGTGTPFSSAAWALPTLAPMGTMRVAFSGIGTGTLQYTFNGVTVTKSISRFAFGSAPVCTWSAFDRASTTNYQDQWWNPAEVGWGLTLAHQGNTIFATLFIYDAGGRGTWLVMSQGQKTLSGNYTGSLYRASGPAFNANPWVAPVLSQVGNMTLTFANGAAATVTYTVNGTTVTKPIQRYVYGMPKTLCEP